jgi:hypothetical protein
VLSFEQILEERASRIFKERLNKALLTKLVMEKGEKKCIGGGYKCSYD